jgi:hypothetical protein
MKITEYAFPDKTTRKEAAYTDFVRSLQTSPAEIAVLPEMPFCDREMFMTSTIGARRRQDQVVSTPREGGQGQAWATVRVSPLGFQSEVRFTVLRRLSS